MANITVHSPVDLKKVTDQIADDGASKLDKKKKGKDTPIDKEFSNPELRKQACDEMKESFRSIKDWRSANIDGMWTAVQMAYRGAKPRIANPHRTVYVLREIFRELETANPQVSQQFFSGESFFKYNARRPGFEDQAQAATDLAHYQLRRMRGVYEMTSWLNSRSLYGVGYLHYGWQTFSRTKFKAKRIVDPLSGQKWWKRKSDEIMVSMPFVECLSPWNCYTMPFVEDPRDSPMFVIRKSLSADDLRTLIRENYIDQQAVIDGYAEDARVSNDMLPMFLRNTGWTGTGTSKGIDNSQEVLIIYSNNGWEYIILNPEVNPTLVRAKRIEGGRMPILTQTNFPQLEEHYGIPDPVVVMEDQRILNDVMSMYVDSGWYQLNPMWKVRASAAKNFDQSYFAPGGKIVVNNPDDVVPLSVNPTLTQICEQANWIRNNMKLHSGVTDELSGAGSTAKTATQHVKLMDAAGVRMKQKVIDASPMFVELYTELYNLNSRHLDTSTMLRIVGEDGKAAFKRAGPDSFNADVDVDITLSNQGMNPAEDAQKWLQIYSATAMDPNINGMLVRERLFRAIGEKRPKMFLNSSATPQNDSMKENRSLEYTGTIPPVNPSDDHQTHMQIHQMFMATPLFQSLPEEWKFAMEQHMMVHQDYMTTQQKSAQNAMQAPQGGQNQEPGQGPSPIDESASMRTEAMFDNGQQGAAAGGGNF